MSRRRIVPGPHTGEEQRLSHAVRIWALRTNKNKKRQTYSVRWIVATEEQHRTFVSRALADAFRSKLLTYVQRGMPFDVTSGLPEPMLREAALRPWYEHACKYVDMKWPGMAPKSRTSIADALATVTPALLATERGRPTESEIRQVLYGWAFVTPLRKEGNPPARITATVRWLERNTVPLAEFDNPARGPELIRTALDTLARRLDGTAAASTTIARKRTVLYNALGYAVELGLLSRNPIDYVAWKAPKSTETVDNRVVVNRRQAQALLTAVGEQSGVARRLVAFFACMYYAALRPGEALDLRKENIVSLPEDGWGEFLLTNSSPRSGTAWTDSGRSRERRELKHRAKRDTRPVPIHPELSAHLRAHLEAFGTAPDGRLFVGPRGGTIGDSAYLRVWHRARESALTPEEQRSPLAGVPYDLRHAAVSTWLNAGVGPQQVAEWAGHSVAVLLRVYAKCIAGQNSTAKRRIEEAMRDDQEE